MKEIILFIVSKKRLTAKYSKKPMKYSKKKSNIKKMSLKHYEHLTAKNPSKGQKAEKKP